MKWVIILLALPALSHQQCFSDNDNVEPSPSDNKFLPKGQQQFSLNLLQAVNNMTGSENVFFSPFSVYNAMLLTYFISGNHTEAKLKEALSIPSSFEKKHVMSEYSELKYFHNIRQTNASTEHQFDSVNRLFVGDKQQVRDCMKILFKDELTTMNFEADPEKATADINAWVAQNTRNQITDLLKPGYLTKFTKLVLANAASFKGDWKSKFPATLTRNELFYISSSKTAFVTMMKQKGSFPYMISESLGAHILEMPYVGDDYSLFVLLPPYASPNGLSNILERLTLDEFDKVLNGLYTRPVEVFFPKFTIEQELKIVAALESIGIGDVFQSTADLSQLTGQPDISLDEAVHKAKIQVDEDGTTAAAATAAFNFRSSRPLEPVTFKCNHPFVYILYDKNVKMILFMGVFNKPN